MSTTWSTYIYNWQQSDVVDIYNQGISDLDISDEDGNTLVRFQGGGIKTKDFDSSQDATESARGLMSAIDKIKLNSIEQGAEVNDVETEEQSMSDLDISDEQGNILARFKDGNIKSKNFDSSKVLNNNFADRPNGGYENFLVTVNNAAENNYSTSQNLQDSVNLQRDRCLINFPINYSAKGNPTRLVIASQGSKTRIMSSTTSITIVPLLDILLAEGYAVLQVNGTPGYIDGIETVGGMCTPGFLKSIQAAYEYVTKKYNLKKDGVLLSGYSQGTAEVWQIAANKVIPVKAMTLFGPCVDIWKLMYAHGSQTHREWMCEQFGFVEKEANPYVLDIFSSIYSIGDIVVKPSAYSSPDTVPTDYEFAYILNNYETWLGYDPICWGTSKDIVGEQFRYRNWVTVQDTNEDLCFQDVCNIVPCPTKMFVGTADDLTTPKTVNWYKRMADNAGMMCHVRYYQGGTHSYTSKTDYQTVQVQTKFGGIITTNVPSWEGMLFLERYDY